MTIPNDADRDFGTCVCSSLRYNEPGSTLHIYDRTTSLCHFCGASQSEVADHWGVCARIMQPAMPTSCGLTYALNRSIAYEHSIDKQHGDRF
jgi:hypothetical protein